MKYIGATDIFVRGPFLVEGIVIGLVGSAIPVAILRFVYVEIVKFITSQFPVVKAFLTFVSVNELFKIPLPVFHQSFFLPNINLHNRLPDSVRKILRAALHTALSLAPSSQRLTRQSASIRLWKSTPSLPVSV